MLEAAFESKPRSFPVSQYRSFFRPLVPADLRDGGGADAGAGLGIANWINSEPLIMEELQGKVVLIDFWTYTCVNCIRTFPALRDWNAKYSDKGLVIVGVHTPEFDFEKVTKNVTQSTDEYNLTWPVAQDNDFGTWRAYSNRFWPAKYLVDSNGVVRYTHFGEGAYIETEEQIRDLLQEAGADLSEIQIGEFDSLECARKHRQRLVAFLLDPATVVTLYLCADERLVASAHPSTRGLVAPHQRGVSDHVGEEDGCEPPLYTHPGILAIILGVRPADPRATPRWGVD